MSARTDRPHIDTDISYPIKPDAKGYARKRYGGETYYFGVHNTWESFGLFGEWRKQLIETGQAPDVKQVKAAIQKMQLEDEPAPSTRRLHASYLAACVLVCAISISLSAMLSNSVSPPVDVDDEFASLTEEEKSLVRAKRKHKTALADKRTAENPRGPTADRVAKIAAAIKEEGLAYGKEAAPKEDGT